MYTTKKKSNKYRKLYICNLKRPSPITMITQNLSTKFKCLLKNEMCRVSYWSAYLENNKFVQTIKTRPQKLNLSPKVTNNVIR